MELLTTDHQISKTGPTARLAQSKREFALLWQLYRQDRATRTASLVFFSMTFLAIAIFIATFFLQEHFALAQMVYDEIDIGADNSLSEKFSHGLSFLAATSFLMCFFQVRSRAAFFLAALCMFIWFDDAAQYHERMGGVISTWLSFKPGLGLRAQDFGEIAAWSLAACVLLVLLGWALRDRRLGDPGVLLGAGICFGALVLFGVVIDMLHVMMSFKLFTLIEDGGEMITMTAFCTLGIAVSRNSEQYFSPQAHAGPLALSKVSDR